MPIISAPREGGKTTLLLKECGKLIASNSCSDITFICVSELSCERTRKQAEEILDHNTVEHIHFMTLSEYQKPGRSSDPSERKHVFVDDIDWILGELFKCPVDNMHVSMTYPNKPMFEKDFLGIWDKEEEKEVFIMKRYIRTKDGKIYDTTMQEIKVDIGIMNTDFDKKHIHITDILVESDDILDLFQVGDLFGGDYYVPVLLVNEATIALIKDRKEHYNVKAQEELNITKFYTKQGDNYILVWTKERGVI